MEIANSMRGITENIISSYDARVGALGDLVFDTHKTLRGFTSDRKKMAKEQAEGLANFVADLTKNVGNMMKGLQKTHKEMAYNLKESLEKGETDRLKDFKDMMGYITKGLIEIENYVGNKLREFHDDHSEMSDVLKKSLAKYVRDIVNDVKKLLGEYRSEMKKTRGVWQGMPKTLNKERKSRIGVPKVKAKNV